MCDELGQLGVIPVRENASKTPIRVRSGGVQYLPAKMIARKNDRWAAAGGSFFPAEMIARKNDRFPATGGKQFTPQK